MEIFRSILTTLAFVSGFFFVVMALVFLYSPKGAIDSEVNRANAVVDGVKKGSKQPNLEYRVNVGYLKLIKNFRRIFLISIGVMITSIIVLRLFAFL
jgi:hypothetical protein